VPNKGTLSGFGKGVEAPLKVVAPRGRGQALHELGASRYCGAVSVAGAAPTRGNWNKGDYLADPSIADFWVCKTSGTPGTWQATRNGLTITATTGTLTITNAKTLSVSNSLTLAGTDSTTMTFPTTSATIARTDAAQTFTGVQTLSSSPVFSSNALTTSGAFTMTIPNGVSTTFAGLGITQSFTQPQTMTNGLIVGDTGIGSAVGALAINTSAGNVGEYALYITDTKITTGIGAVFSTTTMTSGIGFDVLHTTSTMTGNVYQAAMAAGSGTFTGKFLRMLNNNAEKFVAFYDGTLAIGGNTVINSSGIFDVQSNWTTPGIISGLAVIGRVPSGQTTLAQTIWMLFNQGGVTYRVPAWTNT